LLDVNKMEAGQFNLQPVEFDLTPVAHEAFSAVESLRQNRTFAVEAPAEPGTVLAEWGFMGRGLPKSGGNAIKFAPDGSAVRLVIQPAETSVRLSIIDSGCGIAPEFHGRIFTKFGQVKTNGPRVGTGLGLTFCKLAVESHGGRIGVDSAV